MKILSSYYLMTLDIQYHSFSLYCCLGFWTFIVLHSHRHALDIFHAIFCFSNEYALLFSFWLILFFILSPFVVLSVSALQAFVATFITRVHSAQVCPLYSFLSTFPRSIYHCLLTFCAGMAARSQLLGLQRALTDPSV